jgi:transcriptional regulator with XRE-family HTH domain
MKRHSTDDQIDALSALELALGQRIAMVRAARGLTLERLSNMTGFTKGYLSKIENSKVIPPIGTLIRIASELGAEVADLLQSADSRKTEPIAIVRADQRQRVLKGGTSFGYDYIALAEDRHDKRMEPFIMIFPENVDKHVHFEHEGEEFFFVLTGEVEFEALLDGASKRWMLASGDSVYFDSKIPHRGRSVRGESQVLVVIYHPVANHVAGVAENRSGQRPRGSEGEQGYG